MINIAYVLQGIDFEWDREKASSNLRKHGIAFEIACEAFLDPFVYYLTEAGDVEGESREAIIGLAIDWRLLYVVYVLRADVIRLISARLATNSERRQYENQ